MGYENLDRAPTYEPNGLQNILKHSYVLEVKVSDRCSPPAKQQLEPQKQDSEVQYYSSSERFVRKKT